MSLFTELLLIVLLLGFNAFLAASEIAIVSARRSQLRAWAEEGSAAAERVLRLVEDPARMLSTIQVGITLAGFFTSAIGAVTLVRVVAAGLSALSPPLSEAQLTGLALVLVTTALSFLSIVFGELVPKTVAVQHAGRLSLFLARPIELLAVLAHPVVVILTGTTNLILRAFGLPARATLPAITREELLTLLEEAEDEGQVSASEADMVEEAFELRETIVRSVMVPRVDMEALSADLPLEVAIERFFATGFSRLPVYEGDLDHIVGILHVKDVFRIAWSDPAARSQPCRQFARPAYFVPETKLAGELLEELRARQTRMAIVIDEFGGVAGLVTLEDLIEELVGEIRDEFDREYEPLRRLDTGEVEVDGRVGIYDLLDWLDLDEEELGSHEADSVGGLIVERLGRFPEPGETVQIGPLRCEVLTMEQYRVGRVRVARADGAGTTGKGSP
ncbi:Magnesium and cobalt efflux protein CorC [bacterium HR26]|nr:Magnesium and cobalt efflux protein CorC [bacterium HR26]